MWKWIQMTVELYWIVITPIHKGSSCIYMSALTGVPANGAWSQFSCQERFRLITKSWKKGWVLLNTENPMMLTRWSATSSSWSRENSCGVGGKRMMPLLISTVTHILALATRRTSTSHIELLSRWNVLTSNWLGFIYFSLGLIIPDDYHEKAAPAFGYASSYRPMHYATGHLHTLAHRSLCKPWIVMLQSVNGDECETQTDRQREPEAFTEEMGKTWNQMDNCGNEIIIHIAMQQADILQVADGGKYSYLLFSYFPRGTRRSFLFFSLLPEICREGVGR